MELLVFAFLTKSVRPDLAVLLRFAEMSKDPNEEAHSKAIGHFKNAMASKTSSSSLLERGWGPSSTGGR